MYVGSARAILASPVKKAKSRAAFLVASSCAGVLVQPGAGFICGGICCAGAETLPSNKSANPASDAVFRFISMASLERWCPRGSEDGGKCTLVSPGLVELFAECGEPLLHFAEFLLESGDFFFQAGDAVAAGSGSRRRRFLCRRRRRDVAREQVGVACFLGARLARQHVHDGRLALHQALQRGLHLAE